MEPVEKLLANFEHVVFVDEYDNERQYSHIRKWVDPIRIVLSGEQANNYRLAIENYSNNLSLLTGLSINVLPDLQHPYNFEIHFVPWDDIEILAKPHSPNPDWLETIVEDSSCLFIYKRNKKYEIKHAFIYVSIDEPVDEIKSCLLEEMTQALGFPNDSELINPSIFNQWDHLQELSISDEILILTLYDNRLKPGTDREIALKLARIIISELKDRRNNSKRSLMGVN
ncbi:MAG TPA: DUF2927 domain-containing protein [Candidatus Brocadiaceae bacterium]|nr:DUF2927 domain-containing protein [Candidatus Brocadiaceae bacterium]